MRIKDNNILKDKLKKKLFINKLFYHLKTIIRNAKYSYFIFHTQIYK